MHAHVTPPPVAKRRFSLAFSLVELSIVLVILGLLIGGVLSGQSLIRAAQLRAVVSEYQSFVTGARSFRDRYFMAAGDLSNATSFWTTGTVSGNGDGVLNNASAVNVTGEIFQFWNQLALAGLITGTYTGLNGPSASGGTGFDNIPGTNSPKSKWGDAGWGLRNFGIYAGDTLTYAMDYGTFMALGARFAGNVPFTATFKPEEVWNIDTKIDDGKPGQGKVIGMSNAAWGSASACTTSTGNTDYVGNYNLSSSTIGCSLYMPQAF